MAALLDDADVYIGGGDARGRFARTLSTSSCGPRGRRGANLVELGAAPTDIRRVAGYVHATVGIESGDVVAEIGGVVVAAHQGARVYRRPHR